MAFNYDLVNKSLQKVFETTTADQNARNSFKNALMLGKIQNLQEKQKKTEEMEQKSKFDFQLLEKKSQLMTPHQKMMMEWFQKQMEGGGGGGGERRIVPTTTGFTTEKVNPRDDIIEKIRRGEQLSPGDLQIYNETIKKGGQPTDPFASLNQPTKSSQGQPNTGRMKVKIKGGTQTGTIEAGEFDPNLYEKI